MKRQEIIVALENCIFGDYKFLYISPERLDTEIFRTKLRSMNISTDYRRRESLHLAVGLRFPSRLSQNSRHSRAPARSSRTGTDRYRHPRGGEGYSGPAPLPPRKMCSA